MGNLKIDLTISGIGTELKKQLRVKVVVPKFVDTRIELMRRVNSAAEILTSGVNPLPYAETTAASSVAGTTATLNGIANGGTKTATVTFEYWKDSTPETVLSATATASPLAASTPPAFTAVLKGVTALTGSTAYSFRIKVVTTYGTVYGSTKTFTTS